MTAPIGPIAALVATLVVGWQPARAEPARCQRPAECTAEFTAGITVEAGLGFGDTVILPASGDNGNQLGFAGLDLGLGGFVTPRAAILFRLATTSFLRDGIDSQVLYVNAIYGPELQYWPGDRVMVAAGAGLATFGPSPLSDIDDDVATGVAVTARAGYSVAEISGHVIRVAGKLAPSFYDGAVVIAAGVTVEWQLKFSSPARWRQNFGSR